MAYWERTILPDLHERLRLACGTFCDLDLDVMLELVVAAARHVSSARFTSLGVLDRSRREREWSGTAGVDEVTRRRIYPLPRARGVLAELIAHRRGGRSAGSGVRGVGIDHARPYTGLRSGHAESRRTMGPLDATLPLARAGGGEIDWEVILGPVAKRAGAVMSVGTPTIEREHDWTGASG